MGRLASDWEPTPEDIVAAEDRARMDALRDIEAIEQEIDPRCARGGKSYVHFPRFESEEEEEDFRESRLDRSRWIETDGEREFTSRDAETMLQREDIVVKGGGGGKSKNSNRKLTKARPTHLPEDRPRIAVYPFCITRITRGAMWYLRSHPGAGQAMLTQLAEHIEAGKIPPTIPRKTDHQKAKTWNIVVWFAESSIVESLRKRKRVASQWLNMIAIERGGAKVAHLNSWDSTPNGIEQAGKMSYNGGAELAV